MTCTQHLAAELRAHGFRMTPQRTAILGRLRDTPGHLFPADVFTRVRPGLPGVTETTVYRKLECLARNGMVASTQSGDGHLVHEIAGHEHHRVLCRACGRSVEIDHLPVLFLTPGPALAHLPLGLVLTRTGVTTALFLLLRVNNSASLALLLVLTTPWNTVLGALGVLRIPDAFILILGVNYRYIFLLLHTAYDMFQSRRSRAVGRLSGAENRRLLAAIGATLLNKSYYLSGEVYLAMRSRGFRGAIVMLRLFAMRTKDWPRLAVFLAAAVLAAWLGV